LPRIAETPRHFAVNFCRPFEKDAKTASSAYCFTQMHRKQPFELAQRQADFKAGDNV
jgi:hypothetical protein